MAKTKRALCLVDLGGEARSGSAGFPPEQYSQFLKEMAGVLERLGANPVKRAQDTLMASFPQPGPALEATQEIKILVDREQAEGRLPASVGVRVGLHWGEVLRHGSDLFGEAINVAAHLANLARPHQILTTSEILEAAPPSRSLTFRFLTRQSVPGRQPEVDVYELNWEQGVTTTAKPSFAGRGELVPQLVLSCGGKQVAAGPDCQVVTLGRDAKNDLVVPQSWVSRYHARVEWGHGQFVLRDQSSNGTYLYLPQREPLFIKMGEHPLKGEGSILLGDDRGPDSPEAIKFALEKG